MTLISWLAPLSSWLVMLHLGLSAQRQQSFKFKLPNWAFWLAHYAVPLLAIAGLSAIGALNAAEMLGLTVCILSGAGTSVAPWAQRDGALPGSIAQRLALGAIIALATIPGLAFFQLNGTAALQQAFKIAALLIGLFYLPWFIGRFIAERRAITSQQLKLMSHIATFSVAALITLVAITQLPNLPGNAMLIFAGFLIVGLSGIGGALADAKSGLAVTAVVKNITLTILVLSADSSTYGSLSAVAAFGAWMYVLVWPTSYLARHLKKETG